MQLFQFLKKSLFLFIVILIATVNITSAQVLKTGFFVGLNKHTVSVADDEGGILQPGTSLTPAYGIEVILRKNQWAFHTGYFSNDFSTAFYFDSPNSAQNTITLSSSLSTHRIPFIFSREISLTKGVSIAPQAGFSWLIKGSTDTTATYAGDFANSPVQINEAVSLGVNENIFLAEAGLDLNFKLSWVLTLKLGARYSYGLEPIERTEITYQFNGQTYTGAVKSSASGWNFNIGLVIPIYN